MTRRAVAAVALAFVGALPAQAFAVDYFARQCAGTVDRQCWTWSCLAPWHCNRVPCEVYAGGICVPPR